MKRMHIHVGVDRLDKAITFYSALFGATPSKTRADYAKWMLEDPRINFAISTRSGRKGVDHLGIQVDDEGELVELRERAKDADLALFDEGEAVCCYARADKSWLEDPAGIAWEAYKTMEDAQYFGSVEKSEDGACCAPAPSAAEVNSGAEKSAECKQL